MQEVIATKNLVRRFGSIAAVDGVWLSVAPGSIYGFLGPNGSGKTTTIRLLLGLLHADRGEIRLLGRSMPADRISIARNIGAMVEIPSLYDHLTGWENLDISRRLLGLPRKAIGHALSMVDLVHAAKQRVGGYSLGMRQRLGIARALLGSPALLILDEPTNGLDPEGIRDIRQLIRQLANEAGATIFLSSHLLAEVQQVATHVGLMRKGRLIAQGPLDDIWSRGGERLEIAVNRASEAAELMENAGLVVSAIGDNRFSVAPQKHGAPFDPAAINHMLVIAGHEVSALTLHQPTLEDLYVELTDQSPATSPLLAA